MKQYLLSIQQPDGPPPEDLDLDTVMTGIGALLDEMKDEGVWVFNGGLQPPDTATVLHPDGDQVLITDGPYAEGKEHIGGVTVIAVPDLDAALAWASRLSRIAGLPIEVRPFADGQA